MMLREPIEVIVRHKNAGSKGFSRSKNFLRWMAIPAPIGTAAILCCVFYQASPMGGRIKIF